MKVNEAIELLKKLDNDNLSINIELVVEEKKVRELQFLEGIDHVGGAKYIFIDYGNTAKTLINVISVRGKFFFINEPIKNFKL